MALIGKFLIMLVASYLSLSLFGRATFAQIFIISLIGTAVAYLIGDLVILPASNNITTSICDGLLAGVLAFAVIYYWGARVVAVNYWSVLLFAVLVAVAEYFFHNYLKRSEEVAP